MRCSGTLCQKAKATAVDLAGRLPERWRLHVSLRQGTAGATAGKAVAIANGFALRLLNPPPADNAEATEEALEA